MVSIIIPYVDEYDYLVEAIASAVVQQGVDKEIIVVCNSSSDSKGYLPVLEQHPDIICLHEPHRGSPYARNAGLRQAKGEWIQFLDVDDLLPPEKIKYQLAVGQGDVIVSPHTFLYLNGKQGKSKWLPTDMWCGLLNSGLGSTSSMLWRRDALLDVGGWNAAYKSHQEYELLFRLAAAGREIVPYGGAETVVRQRQTGSITIMTQSARVSEGIRLREDMWTHLCMQGEDTPERFEAFRQYIFRQLRALYRQDIQKAEFIFEKYFLTIPFTPKDIHVPGYRWLYEMFGFQKTEALIQHLIAFRK